MVTSWNSRCGIAENSRYIAEHIGDGVDFDIFADVDVEVIDPGAERGVVRAWKDRWTPDLGDLEDALLLSDADVLHVQFNFGFFEFGRLAEVLDRQLHQRGVVLTMHRTLDYDDRGELLTIRQIRDTLARVDRLIVHQESDARYLAEMGIEANVSLVPIGAAPPPPVTPAQVRAELGLGDRPVVGTFGFLLPHKGTLDLVIAMDELRRTYPDILLLAQCARYPHVESRQYEDLIRTEIAERGLENNVLLITDYLADDAARVLLRSADVIVLPYHDTGESSSAALRFILPLGRAVVVSDQPLFADASDAVLTMESNDVRGNRRVGGSGARRRRVPRGSGPTRRAAVDVLPLGARGRRAPSDLRRCPTGGSTATRTRRLGRDMGWRGWRVRLMGDSALYGADARVPPVPASSVVMPIHRWPPVQVWRGSGLTYHSGVGDLIEPSGVHGRVRGSGVRA